MKLAILFTTAVVGIMASSGLASASTALPDIFIKDNLGRVASADTRPPAPEQAPEPAPAPVMVTVQPGDYLEKVALANNTTSLRLFYANTEIADPDLIYPGQQLRVPTPEEVLTPRDVPANEQISAAEVTVSQAASRPHASNYIPSDGSVWDRLAACESGGNWAINTGNGYYGGLQFSLSTWYAVGGGGLPSDASREEQIMRGQILQSRSGWGQWPACVAKLGLQ